MTTGRVFAAVAALVVLFCLPASAAPPSPAAPHAPAPKPPEAAAPRPAEPDAASRNTVARARMLECGHQWNSQKKNGTASGTWKDFSRSCLAQR